MHRKGIVKMFKNSWIKVVLAVMLMNITLVLGTASDSFGFKEEIDPSTEHLSGPAIPAKLTAVYDGNTNTVAATIEGICQGKDVILHDVFPPIGDFATITAADIKNNRIDVAVECHGSSPVTLIIDTVVRFVNTGTTITADIIILRVVPR